MNKYLFPVYAVLIGFVIVKLSRGKPLKHLKLLLAFSGAFLLSLTVFKLLPEVYEHLEPRRIGLLIMAGILLQIFLEFFSKGAEHGHIHIHRTDSAFPWMLFVSLCIHAFLEGFPIHQHNDMAYGVLIHKIPIAILLTSFLLNTGMRWGIVILLLLLFTAMTPLGTLVSNEFNIGNTLVQSMNALVIGIFFHISTIILFESNEEHRFNLQKLLVIISGVLIAYLI